MSSPVSAEVNVSPVHFRCLLTPSGHVRRFWSSSPHSSANLICSLHPGISALAQACCNLPTPPPSSSHSSAPPTPAPSADKDRDKASMGPFFNYAKAGFLGNGNLKGCGPGSPGVQKGRPVRGQRARERPVCFPVHSMQSPGPVLLRKPPPNRLGIVSSGPGAGSDRKRGKAYTALGPKL